MLYFLIGAAVIVVFLCFRSVSDDPHAWDFIEIDDITEAAPGERPGKIGFAGDPFEGDIILDPGYASLSCNVFHHPENYA